MVRACVCVRSLLVVVFASLIPLIANAQFAEQNVNMVSGTQWPGGDPFLRQQNEPSLAVSTRNPLHLLAVANDYRSVDIPFLAPAGQDLEERGDAWLGVFKSKDGGNKWFSILLDGYPQQANLASPLNGFQAAADGVVRAGNNGMFYMTGIVLNRGTNPASGVLLARFIDNNNSEVGDPIVPIDTKLIDQGSSGQFIDKPWLAVAPSTNGGQCTLAGQTFPAQNVYLAYTVFVGNDINVRTKIMFARSTDCGATWSTQKLSEMYSINQGPTIAIDPNNPSKVYVAWRRFKGGNDSDSIIFTKSTDGGSTFTKGAVVANITPFEQGTGPAAIRTNAYATMAVDGSGRIYMAWSQRVPIPANSIDPNTFDGRIVLISSTDGIAWSPSSPLQVSPIMGGTSNGRGHQFMPTMTFAAGKLTLAWYDMRQDHTVGNYQQNILNPVIYDETRAYASPGNLPGQPTVVFWQYLSDTTPPNVGIKLNRRHTLEIYAVESINLGSMPTFTGSARVSRYKFGAVNVSDPIHDLQLNPPNLPMFRQGTVPFFGDYIDLAAYTSPVSGPTLTVPTRVRHVVWTDNRDVRAPLGAPPDWTKYTPVHYGNGSTSIFDPSQTRPPCAVDPLSQQSPYAGTRNQNIYTSRVTDGMFAGSPGNAKPLGVIQRAFTVFVQNARSTVAFYRLSIVHPLPANTAASFHQFDPPADFEDVAIPAHSTATRTVFVTSTTKHSRVDVSITEITMVGGTEVQSGLSTDVGLNTDPQNPDIGNPDIGNPDIGNQEVFNPDIGNPDIGNPDIGNPDIGNPDIGNPDIGNPDIGNPDIGNPDIGNPDIGNPDIGNPDIGNPDIGNQSVSDTSWPAHNSGNTTGGYTVKLLKNGDLPPSVTGTQLILSKTYDTPAARGCDLGVEHHRQIVTSVKNPLVFANPGDATNPSLDDPDSATIWLAPGETGNITLRLIGTFPIDQKIDASQFITPVAIAHSVNTADAGPNGSHAPSVSISISPSHLPDALIGQEGDYNYQLLAVGGVDSKTWSGGTGLPPGFTLSPAGIVSGTPTTPGFFPFTATVTGTVPPRSHTSTIQFRVVDFLRIPEQSLSDALQNRPYTATLTLAGGGSPFVWSLNDSSLPDGLSLAPNGVISGTPTTAGTFQFSVRVQDATYPTPQTRFASLALTVEQTYTVQGHLTYNGSARTPTAPPQFFLRNEDTGLQQDADFLWNGADTITIAGIPAGNFGFEVISNENPANQLNYPGDFYSFTVFNTIPATDGGFVIQLTRLIHVTLPFNNAAAFAEPFGCPPTLSAVAPTQVAWEAIDVPATTYHWRIDRMTCGVFPGVQVIFGSTTGTSATFDPLPPNAANEYYLLTIDADSPTQIYVGQIMTHGTTWYGWDLRFVVQSPLQ